jgi:Ca2+-binding EF-hand superfamily protein
MGRNRNRFNLLICLLGTSFLFCGPVYGAEDRAYVIQFYKRFDKNSDGLLEPKEWKSSRSRDVVADAIEDAGLDPEKAVSLKAVIDSRLGSSSKTRKDDKEKPRGYRAKIGQQRLDKDVPEWFRERDKDRNGQVAMAEYSDKWTDKLVADFLELDINRDGVITPKESQKGDDSSSRSSVASTSTSRSKYGLSSSSTSKEPNSDETASSKPASSSEGDSAKTTTSDTGGTDELEGISDSYLGYAKSIIKKYDTNGDGTLTKGEWGEMSRDPSAADKDGDRKITYVEYVRWIAKK